MRNLNNSANTNPPESQAENVSVTNQEKAKHRAAKIIGKVALVILETILLVVLALYGVMYIVVKGPSPTARNLFVMSVRETSAVGFLADLFLSEEEIAAIEAGSEAEKEMETDTSLINMPKPSAPDSQAGPVADEWGLIDDDGDGIILEPVRGEGYSGYMMVVLDPSRVILGCDTASFGRRGYTVADMVKKFDAVAGINAGGFDDPDGRGNGSVPDTMVVSEGKTYYASSGIRDGFVGFDSNHIMHTGKMTPQEIKKRDIQYGVCFGPVLISNGVANESGEIRSGVNPRTAIGQRSDGAILFLVIDGRQVISLGATYQDLIDVFFSFGAVNACNLDGGSSSLMWYQGDYVNNCASVVGIRPVPTTFLVMKEGAKDRG